MPAHGKLSPLPTTLVSHTLQLIGINNCDFTYVATASSPSLTSISASTPKVTGSNTKTITLTGTNLVDGSNFAEVAFKHTITKQTTTFTAQTATATSVTFDLTPAT